PGEGDFIKITYAKKPDRDRRNKWRLTVLKIESTKETNPDLIQKVEGLLKVKFKNNSYSSNPDFAFVDGFYVPKALLKKKQITEDCKVEITTVLASDIWKMLNLDISEELKVPRKFDREKFEAYFNDDADEPELDS